MDEEDRCLTPPWWRLTYRSDPPLIQCQSSSFFPSCLGRCCCCVSVNCSNFLRLSVLLDCLDTELLPFWFQQRDTVSIYRLVTRRLTIQACSINPYEYIYIYIYTRMQFSCVKTLSYVQIYVVCDFGFYYWFIAYVFILIKRMDTWKPLATSLTRPNPWARTLAPLARKHGLSWDQTQSAMVGWEPPLDWDRVWTMPIMSPSLVSRTKERLREL